MDGRGKPECCYEGRMFWIAAPVLLQKEEVVEQPCNPACLPVASLVNRGCCGKGGSLQLSAAAGGLTSDAPVTSPQRENPIVPYIGLQCRVGACLKPPSKEPPSPASPPPPSPPFIPEIPRSLYEPLTLALLAAIVLSAITAAVVLVAVDIRRLRRKASAWDRGSGEGSGGDRRGAAERRQLEALSGEQQEALLPRDWEGGVLSSGYLNEGDNIDCLSDVGEENIVSPHGVVEPVVISWEDICYSAYQVTTSPPSLTNFGTHLQILRSRSALLLHGQHNPKLRPSEAVPRFQSPFKRKRILHRVSAVCGSSPFAQGRRGCLLAVLGPSGAGVCHLPRHVLLGPMACETLVLGSGLWLNWQTVGRETHLRGALPHLLVHCIALVRPCLSGVGLPSPLAPVRTLQPHGPRKTCVPKMHAGGFRDSGSGCSKLLERVPKVLGHVLCLVPLHTCLCPESCVLFAGKTSLMDCLAGRREGSGVEGEVRLNGNLMTAKAMRQMAGYVQQEDVLPGTSTVWEYLWFIASLRLPPSLTEGARERRVSSLLRDLHLEKAWPLALSCGFYPSAAHRLSPSPRCHPLSMSLGRGCRWLLEQSGCQSRLSAQSCYFGCVFPLSLWRVPPLFPSHPPAPSNAAP